MAADINMMLMDSLNNNMLNNTYNSLWEVREIINKKGAISTVFFNKYKLMFYNNFDSTFHYLIDR